MALSFNIKLGSNSARDMIRLRTLTNQQDSEIFKSALRLYTYMTEEAESGTVFYKESMKGQIVKFDPFGGSFEDG